MVKKTVKHRVAPAADNPAPAISFEDALEKLERIVSELEGAEVPLEKALTLYEEGVGLARFCSQQLKFAERRVELLEEKNGQLQVKPFPDAAEDTRRPGTAKGFEEEAETEYEHEAEIDDEDEAGEDNEDETDASDEDDQKTLF